MTEPSGETAIVLSGGGARAAYQIGALRGVAHILGRSKASPFRVISGTSAGAINAAALAANAGDLRRGVAHLLRLWRNITVSSVYEADFVSVAMHGMRWLTAVLIGARGPRSAASMLNNAPLRKLLRSLSAMFRWLLTLACATTLAFVPARAAVLVHEFAILHPCVRFDERQ